MNGLRVHPFVDSGNGHCETCGKTQPFPGYPGASDWVHAQEGAEMSSYHFDPHDWRDKLPKGVIFYDFGGGQYQMPQWDQNAGTYLTSSLVALCEDPVPDGKFKILMFTVPHAAMIRKNSDWAPLVDRMVDFWKSAKFEPTEHGALAPMVNLYDNSEKTPADRAPVQDKSDG